MFRLTLAQMRRSLGRLTAAGIAIVIGTAFVAATLLASGALQRGTFDAVTARYGQSDIVVKSLYGGDLPADEVERVVTTPGVAAAAPLYQRALRATNGATLEDGTYFYAISTTPYDDLRTYGITEGRAPSAANEIALAPGDAERLGLDLGATLTTTEDGNLSQTWTVVGLSSDPGNAHLDTGTPALLTPAGIERFPVGSTSSAVLAEAVLVQVAPGTDASAIEAAISHDDVIAKSRDVVAQDAINSLSEGENVFTLFILGFAGLALIVAALVIANTFQVLIAQRRRTLALLRCTGASIGQLRRSVLLEGTILGLGSSIVGVLLGTGLVQLGLSILDHSNTPVPLPSTVQLSVSSILAPIIVGTLVTTLACLVPAREATRVPPLAALRPIDTPSRRSRAGVVRAVATVLLTAGGFALLALGIIVAKSNTMFALFIGISGGAASFVGITLGAVFWIPPVARAFGAIVSRSGPAARLAVANGVRNPRRTAATSSALLIGVTLVAMMAAGAASARSTLADQLDGRYPVDASASFDASLDSTSNQQFSEALEKIRTTPGVRAAVPVSETSYAVASDNGNLDYVAQVLAIAPADAATVIHDGAPLPAPDDGEILVPPAYYSAPGADTGNDWRMRVSEGSEVRLGDGSTGPVVTVRAGAPTSTEAFVSPATMAQVEGDSVSPLVWLAFTADADPADVVKSLDDALTGYGVWVTSPALERAYMEQVVDTILAVIVGLLAAAVLIALLGVANTLSLSVLERRRESATLRAIGLSKRQLRRSLSVEGMFIAGVGAVLGCVLGLVYGWGGAWIVLSAIADEGIGSGAGKVTLTIPWMYLGFAVLVSVAAGLLASVIPARGALRTSPVEALAVD